MGMMRNALAAEAYDREYSNRELLSRIGEYFRPYRARLVVVIVAVTVLSFLGAASPILIARGVGALDAPQGSSTATALLLVLAILVVGVLQWGVNYVRRLQTSQLMGDVVADMRSDAFRSVVNHDLSFFDQYQSGRVVSRITSDTEEFGRAAVLVTEVVSQLLLIFILLIVLLRVNVPLTIVLLLMAPLGLLVSAAFQKVARRTTRQSQRAVGEVNVAIQEAVTGIRVAKNFHQEQSIYDDFLDVNALSYEIQVRRGMVLSSVFPTLQLVIGIGTAVLLFLGGYGVSASIITAGAWFLFMNSVSEFWFPITNLSAFWSQFQSALSATERVFALQDAQPAIVQIGDEKVVDLDGDIEFEHVDFRYSEKEQVLDDFSLHIAAGEAVALVGHTGAGKSSIAKLVTRYYEFQSGGLTIDGKDIRTLDLQSYRRRLGIVNQSPFLFSGSVADNIRYAAPELGDGEVEAIARRIGGGDWLETLPDGLQTDVGERGVRLSLGQRQLVVLARMLAQNPAILILDEATASVDPFTEAQIQEALRLLLRDRTSIVVAHRLSTVKAADRIVVLQKGRIIEEGSHDALMAAGGHYAELYGTYFRHQSLAYIESRGQGNGGRSDSAEAPSPVSESSQTL